jgi:hypothetical protein
VEQRLRRAAQLAVGLEATMAAQPVSSRIQEEMFMLSTEATGDVDRDRGGRRGGGGGGNSGRSHGGRGRYISAATRGGVPRSRTHPASSGTAASLSFDILALPDEIIYHIVSFLDGKSLSALARTSHFFHELALTDDMWKGVWHQTWRLPFEDSVIVSVPAAYQRGVISDSVPHSVRDFVQARWYIERFVQAGGNVDVWRSKLGLNARHVRTGAQLRELFIRWVKPCLRILFLDLGKFNAGRNYNSLRAQFMSPGIQHSSALPSILTCNYRGILALVLAEQIRAAFVLSVTREQQLGALELLVVLLRELILNGHLMLFGLPRCVESGYVRERLRFEYVSQLCSLFTGAMEPLLEGLPGSTDVELRIQMSAFLFQAYGAVALSARLQPEILGLMRTRASAQYEFLHSQGPSAHWAITEFHSFRLNVASQLVALDRLDEAEPDLTDLMRLLREDGDAIREVVGSALYEIVLETMCHVERLLAMIAERRQVSLGASHEAVGEVVMPYFNRQLTLIERIATEIELTPEQDSIAADVLARKSEYLSTADAAAVLKLAVLRYGKVRLYVRMNCGYAWCRSKITNSRCRSTAPMVSFLVHFA